MNPWIDRILKEFPADLARLWIAADPDDVLLDEQVLSGLRRRGFELIPFEDSVAFRAEYEDRYRSAWDWGEEAPAKALVLHLRGTNVNGLPWDYLRQARRVSLSLANLFPKLSYPVVRLIRRRTPRSVVRCAGKACIAGPGRVRDQRVRPDPHLQDQPAFDLAARGQLASCPRRLHYRDSALPLVMADHVAHVLIIRRSRVCRSANCSHRRAPCFVSSRTLGTAIFHALG